MRIAFLLILILGCSACKPNAYTAALAEILGATVYETYDRTELYIRVKLTR